MSNRTKGNLLLLLTAVVWGTGFIAQKIGNNYLPPMTFNALRQLVATAEICPMAIFALKKSGYLSASHNSVEELAYKKKRMARAGVISGLFMLLGSMTQQMGMVTVSAGKSGFISSLYIVFTPIFAVAIGKRVKPKTIISLVIAVAGFSLLSLKGGLGGATAGDWLTLISAIGFGGQIVAVGCFVDKDNSLLLSVMQLGFSGAVGLVIALMVEDPTMAQLSAGLLPMLYSGLIPGALGFTFQIMGQKYADPTTAALLMSLEAVFAAVFGGLMLGETMTGRELLGCAVIFVAIIMDQIDLQPENIKFLKKIVRISEKKNRI